MFKPLKFNRLKKVIDDKEEHIVIEKDKYDPDTRELSKKEEHMVDLEQLEERERILHEEVEKIANLRSQANKGNFDKVEDRRNKQ